MEFTREIYWNVGTGVLVPMYVLAALAFAVAVHGFAKGVRTYRLGRPAHRLDRPLVRAAVLLESVLLQARVLRRPWPGGAHALMFWGILVLFVGSLLVLLQADFTEPVLGRRFLTGRFYLYFSLTLDVAGAAALVGLAGFAFRRYALRPPGLDTRPDAAFVHLLLLCVLLSGFVVEGLRMAVTEVGGNPVLARYSPVGLLFSLPFAGLQPARLEGLHQWLWWLHLVFALAVIACLPYTRLRHVVTTAASNFFADLGPRGKLETLDFGDDAQTTYGAATIADLRWKDLLDADACMLCTRCQDACPAHAVGKSLSPMKLVATLRASAFERPSDNLVEAVTAEAVWACSNCHACEEACPASVEHVSKIVSLRRDMVLMQGRFPDDATQAAMEKTEVNANPLGRPYAARGDWAAGLGLAADTSDADILYFAGCYASFDARSSKVARSFIDICRAAGVRVAVLGKREKCCGEPVRRMGNEYLYQALAMDNVAAIGDSGARKIVTTCPHCYCALSRDYRDLGLEQEVEHYTVFLDRLVAEGRLSIEPASFQCTYHDSCTLGRVAGVYDAPRALIRAAGGEIVEMQRSREGGFCCGAGGGRILAEDTPGGRMNEERVRQARATGAGYLISNCPFCLTMLEDGVKTAGGEGHLRPRDIAEVVAERIREVDRT
jgi:Fe-S oxidoreductase/nitrate reductase gamma subunit